MNSYSLEQVALHNKANDCWIVIRGKVYDVTKFLDEHPGGRKVLLNVAGKDATVQFDTFHKPDVLQKYKHLCIGQVVSKPLAAEPFSAKQVRSNAPKLFGSKIPYSEPSWLVAFSARLSLTTNIPIWN